MTKKIMIVGVGGQGALLASKTLGQVLLDAGFDVKVSEVHGMSQRVGSVMSNIDRERNVMKCTIGKCADYASVRAVILSRAVCIEQSDAHGFSTEHQLGIVYLQFVDPLGDGVIVHLLDRNLVHNIFIHNPVIVTIYLRTGEMNQAEPVFFLQADDILGSDAVGMPYLLIIVLTIPSAELSSQIIDVIEGVLLENPLQLTVFSDIASDILWMMVMH